MQPDIEIYIKDRTAEEVHRWLQGVFGHCSDWVAKGRLLRCECDGMAVTWYAKAADSWNSLLFDSPHTPWADDLACALAANAALVSEVRCAPGGWSEEQGEEDADRWVRVVDGKAQEFIWRTS